MSDSNCTFCKIIAGKLPATVVREWPDAIAIVPLNPVVENGHLLVIPRVHVANVSENRTVSQATMYRAAELAGEWESCNVITSQGAPATQTVFHLHIHLVRRRPGDGLPLLWTPQQQAFEAGLSWCPRELVAI